MFTLTMFQILTFTYLSQQKNFKQQKNYKIPNKLQKQRVRD
jgi:hypothetical protein